MGWLRNSGHLGLMGVHGSGDQIIYLFDYLLIKDSIILMINLIVKIHISVSHLEMLLSVVIFLQASLSYDFLKFFYNFVFLHLLNNTLEQL